MTKHYTRHWGYLDIFDSGMCMAICGRVIMPAMELVASASFNPQTAEVSILTVNVNDPVHLNAYDMIAFDIPAHFETETFEAPHEY